MNIDTKILNKTPESESNSTLKVSHTKIKGDLSQGCKDFLQYLQINQRDTPH